LHPAEADNYMMRELQALSASHRYIGADMSSVTRIGRYQASGRNRPHAATRCRTVKRSSPRVATLYFPLIKPAPVAQHTDASAHLSLSRSSLRPTPLSPRGVALLFSFSVRRTPTFVLLACLFLGYSFTIQYGLLFPLLGLAGHPPPLLCSRDLCELPRR
jgi:hypothetical protein